jgi:5-(carboxyamino)imidazole ribonucleotide synthase
MSTEPASPTVGVLGAGQLGRMLGLVGAAMGIRCRFLDTPSREPRPTSAVADLLEEGFTVGPHLDRFLSGNGHPLDAVTYEFENVPAELAEALAERVPVRPSPRSLHIAQDRLRERELFEKLGIDTPKWAAVSSPGELHAAIDAGFPLPAILKTRRMGYDGKGQAWVHEPSDAEAAWRTITGSTDQPHADAILDEVIAFDREISIVAVRSLEGETRCYPPVENAHRNGILVRSVAPARGVNHDQLTAIERAAAAVADELDHVGVLAVEFFQTADGVFLANEFAPRVHNTGHWTIEGAETSQFENHLRAVLGLPLGSCAMRSSHAAMVNIIGAWPDRARLLSVPGASLHDYEKSPKPGRKIGHVTVTAGDRPTLENRLREVEPIAAAQPD